MEKNIWYYEMSELGYNYRITDIQAALGKSQLKKSINFSKQEIKLLNFITKVFQNFLIQTLKFQLMLNMLIIYIQF